MVILYNLGIRVYLLLINIVSPFNSKARLWLYGRKKWYGRLKSVIDTNSETVWIHCSSLGEFEQGRPIIEALKIRYPNLKILLTFFSPSGYEVRKNYQGADYVFYLPIDTARNARKLIDLVNPKFVVFVKYEFWYHYLRHLKKKSIPTYIVSAIFRDDQVFFKPYGKWYRSFLRNFDHLFVQNQHSLELLNTIGITNVTICGDTRFDRVAKVASEAQSIPFIEKFCAGERVIVAGSTWPRDEELLIEYYKNNSGKAKLIIAPHEIDAAHIQSIQQTLPLKSILYTQHNAEPDTDARVLIIDTIGLLASVYRYGHIAYIGGGFGVGIHNTLEAATFGLPVIFGPNYHKFQEAKELITRKAAFSINSLDELSHFLNLLLTDEQVRAIAGDNSKKFVLSGVGATNRILEQITQNIQF